MTETRQQLREQLRTAVEPADYPVEGRTDIITALPNGMLTTFEAGEFSMSAAQIAARLYEYQDFPYETPEDVVDDLLDGLVAEELIED